MADLNDIRNAILRHGLAAQAVDILKFVKPAVRIRATKFMFGKVLAPNDSMFAGPVHLAPGQQWPMSDGRAMRRLVQVRLSDVAPHEPEGLLPRRGLLTFWLDEQGSPWGSDPNDRGKFRVLFSPREEVEPAPAHRPAQYGDWEKGELEPYAKCKLEFERTIMLPPSEHGVFAEGVERRPFAKLRGYFDLMMDDAIDNDFSEHLFGYPGYIDNPPEVDCQFASNGIADYSSADPGTVKALWPGINDWLLLLALGSSRDDGPGWQWGSLRYWIRKQDLAKANFDNCWMTMDSA